MAVRPPSAADPPRFAGRRERVAVSSSAAPIPSAPSASADESAKTHEFPLSFGQERLWFFDQLVPRSDVYNISVAERLQGSLDVAALAASVDAIRRRHESCRTTFREIEGRPIQVIAPPRRTDLPVVSLESWPAEARLIEARRRAAAEARRPFDLTRGPLMRTTLLRLAADDHVLLVTFHHIVADGWSLGILFHELHILYSAAVERRTPTLPDLPIQYADFAVWQRQSLQGQALKEQLDYWTERLRGTSSVLTLPTDRARPLRQTYGGGEHGRLLPAQLGADLKAVGRVEGATLFMVLLAAFQALLARYSGETDIPVLCSVSNRDRLELQGIVGFFVNLLVMRTDVGGNPTFRELVRRVSQVTVDAYAHQDLPFEVIADKMEQGRDPSRSPLSQIAFSFASQPKAGVRLHDLKTTSLFVPRPVAKLDLTLFMREEPDGLVAALEYNVDLFDAATIVRMLDRLEAWLTALAADPDQRIGMVPLFAPEMAEQLRMPVARLQRLMPLAPAQREVYDAQAASTDHADRARFVVASALDLGGRVDRERWRQAVLDVARADDMCRTRFCAYGGRPHQFVDGEAAVSFEWISQHAAARAGDRVDAVIDLRRRRGIDRHDAALCRHLLIESLEGSDVAVLLAHRAVADRRSAAIFFEKVCAVYRGDADRRQDAPAGRSYLDGVGDRLAAIDSSASIDFWKTTLAGVVPVDGAPRDPQATRRRSQSALVTGAEQTRVDRLCAVHSCDLSTYVLAACALAIQRAYDPPGDIVIHHSLDDRSTVDASTTGCLTQIVPVVFPRRGMREVVPVSDYIAALCGHQRDAGPHRHISMSAQTRLTDTQAPRFFFHDDRVSAIDAPGGVRRPTWHDEWADDEVHVTLEEREDGLAITAHYHERTFADAGFLDRLLACSRQMAAGARTLGDVDVLLDEDRRRVAICNDTAADWPIAGWLHEQFEAQAARTPDAVAVSGAGTATYRELDEQSSRWARGLRAFGAGREVLVALVAPRSADVLAAILAVFKAGAAFLPIDPVQPPARQRHLLTRGGCALALVADELAADLRQTLDGVDAAAAPVVVTFSQLDDERTGARSELAAERAAPNGLCYVIYTSGSTGEPKGAMLVHEGMRNHLAAKVASLDLTSADVLMQSASQAVDVSVWQFLTLLPVGGRVHIVSDEVARDPRLVMQTIDTAGVTVVEIVPSMLHAMLDDLSVCGDDRPALSSLRWLVVNGEVLPPELCRQWLHLYPDAPIVNAYGPTECSDDVTQHYVRTLADADIARLPIGRMLGNLRMHVLDRQLRPVPNDVPGHLYVGGTGVGRGYRDDPERTARSFIPDPFSDAPGARLYRTGDIGRLLPGGSLDFFGRADHQVKVRGYRVELTEIEAALLLHDAVRQAAAVTRPDAHGGLRVVAYVVPASGQRIDIEDVLAFLKARLPEYMVPSAFIALDAMPLMPNGKIDRRSLPADAPAMAPADAGYVAPRTPNEERVAQIWAQVLDVERVGIHDNFFALGGHSLLATQVVSRLRYACQLPHLPLQLLFDAPTVSQLALGITQLQVEQEDVHEIARLVAEIRHSSRAEAP